MSDSARREPPTSSPEPSAAQRHIENIENMVRAHYGAICVRSPEEPRILRQLYRWTQGRQTYVDCLWRWSRTEGLVPYEQIGNTDEDTLDPVSALDKVLETPDGGGRDGDHLFVFSDLDAYFDDFTVLRRLRDVAQRLRGQGNTLLLLSPRAELPPELEKDVALTDFPLPDRVEMGNLVDSNVGDLPEGFPVDRSEELRDEVIGACMGLTWDEAEDALAKAVIETGGFESDVVDAIQRTKRETIRKSGALEVIEVEESLSSVGGLEALKDWVRRRKRVFGEEARRFGIENPKGLLTMGVPGGGKGLSAKAVAHEWRLPLLRLDMGAIYGKWVGESEGNLRSALEIAGATSPCVLWIDEIEKALGGAGGNAGDGGTSRRVFGTLLTWLQEKEDPVFCYFTANDVLSLPPELLRKGRVDEIFFIDLPGPAARREILEIHLRKRERDPGRFDLERMVEACRGMVGAEIEQGIKEALVDAFSEGCEELETRHVTEVFERTVPLIKTQREKLQRLRRFVEQGRAVQASYEQADIDDAFFEGPTADRRPPSPS